MSMAKRLSLTALAAVFGMALMVQSANAAPLLTSVKITSPDSGATVGIGGIVTVEVKASVLNPGDDFAALVWLVSDKSNPEKVLFDNNIT